MAEVVSVVDSNDFDVDFFDSVDFNLLDDDGNFEQFCMSMNFNPLENEPVNQPPNQTIDGDNQVKKRKLGTLMVQNPADLGPVENLPTDVDPAGRCSPDMSAITEASNIPSAKRRPSATSTGSTSTTAKPPVKKKASVKKTPSGAQPVINGSDIRARYPEIFSQIFNNYDKLSFSRIMNNYCEDDLLVIYEYVGGINPYGPSYLEVRGLEAVVVFWDSLLSSIPDSLFEVFTTKFKVLPNDFTSIVCTFSFKGTKMYEISGVDENSERSVVVSFEKMSIGSEGGDGDSVSTGTGTGSGSGVANGRGSVISSLASNVGENSPVDARTSKPLRLQTNKLSVLFVHYIGTLTFYVSPNKKIYRISFVHSLKPSEVPVSSDAGGYSGK